MLHYKCDVILRLVGAPNTISNVKKIDNTVMKIFIRDDMISFYFMCYISEL